jgi:two-component system sensor histidine kinase VicK
MKTRKQSIQWRLVVIYVLVIVIVMQAVSFYLIDDIERMLEESFENTLNNTSNLLVQKLSNQLDNPEYFEPVLLDELRYQRPNPDLSSGSQDYNILLFNNEFKMLFEPEESYWVDDLMLNLAENEQNYDSTIRQDPVSEVRYLNIAREVINEEGNVEGYVYIIAAMEEQVYAKVKDIRDILFVGTGITLVISLVLSLALARTITKPIKELTHSAAEMARGNFSQQIEVHSNDEIGQLGEMFNSMATQLDQTLGEISNEKSKMDAIFTYMSNGVIAFDITGELLHINPRAKELLVLPEEDTDIVKEIVEKLEIEDIDKTVNSNRLIIKEVKLPYDGGRIIRVQQAPFKREEQLNGVIMVLEDITEQQKLDRMRREFIANVSHELKTPLTNIQIRIQTLQEYLKQKDLTPNQLINEIKAGWKMLNYSEDEILAEFPAEANSEYDLTYQQLKDLYIRQITKLQEAMLPVIETETKRMNKLVRDLLQLSQLDSEQNGLNMVDFQLDQLAGEVTDRMASVAKDKDMSLNFNTEGKALVNADKDAIEQVLVNVISNAIKYSPEGKDISVILKNKHNVVEVSVIDNGIGIPAQDLPRIFERFYRVDKARSRQLGGTGLGLAIAKEIIEAHGGKIEIFSEAGKGTEVQFTVPLKKEEKL